jgi:NADH dehydrogenase
MQGARHAALTILRRLRGEQPTPFVYRDLGSMAIVGRRAAVSDLGWIKFSGVLAWLAWLFLHIFMLIGFRNRMVVLFEWAVAYLTFQRGARLITGDARPGDRQT